jgi:hypothetical protein
MGTELTEMRAVGTQAVKEALQAGFPITCASCEYLHNAQKTDAQNCGRLLTCGGPIFGRSFPDYKGPLTPEALEKICLICGSQTIDFHILAGLRRLGLCFKHRAVFSRPLGPGATAPMIVKIPGRLV